MSKKKKENKNRKRKQPIPPVSAHPTKKQIEAKRNAKRKWTELDGSV
jgi:hypothetical protein